MHHLFLYILLLRAGHRGSPYSKDEDINFTCLQKLIQSIVATFVTYYNQVA